MKNITLLLLAVSIANALWGQNKTQAFNLGHGQLLGTLTTSNGVIAYTNQGTKYAKYEFSSTGILLNQTDITPPTITIDTLLMIKRDAQGVEIFRKTIPANTLARFNRVERAIELNNGQFILAGFHTVGSTIFLRLIKCDASLQIIKEVLLHSETLTVPPVNALEIGLLENYQQGFDIAYSLTSFPANASDKLAVKLSRYDADLNEIKTYTSEACNGFYCKSIDESLLLSLSSNASTTPSPYGGTLSNGHNHRRYFERSSLTPEVNVRQVVYWEVYHNTPGRREITELTYPTVPPTSLPGTLSYGKYTTNGLLLAATNNNDGIWFSLTGNSILGLPDLSCQNVQAQQNGQQLEIGYQLRNLNDYAASQAFVAKYQLLNVAQPLEPAIPLGEQTFTTLGAKKDSTILTSRQLPTGLNGNYLVSVVINTISNSDSDPSNQSAQSSAFQILPGGSNTSCGNNLLSNPSFDQGLSNWSGSGGTVSLGNLEMSTIGSTRIQTVVGESGKSYTFTYTAKTPGINQNITFGMKFLSSSWNVLDSKWSSFDSPGVFSSNQLQASAPVGTAWVEVAILKTNGGTIQISEVCLSNDVIPPSSTCTGNILPASGLFGSPCVTVGSLEMTVQDTGLYQLSFDAFVSSGAPLIGGFVYTKSGNYYYHFNTPASLPQGFSHQDFGIYLNSDAVNFQIIYYANSSTSCTQITNACLQKRIIGKPEIEIKLVGTPPTQLYPGQQSTITFDVKNLSETPADTATQVFVMIGPDTIYSKFHLLQAKDSIRITVPYTFNGNLHQNYTGFTLAANENRRIKELFLGNNRIQFGVSIILPPNLPAACLKTDLAPNFKCAKKTATGYDVASFHSNYFGNDSIITFLSLNTDGEIISQSVKVIEYFSLIKDTILVTNISNTVLRKLKIPPSLSSQFGANWWFNESGGVFYFYWAGTTSGTHHIIATDQQFNVQRNFVTPVVGYLRSIQGEMLITQTYYIVPMFYPPNYNTYEVRYEHHLYTFSGIKSRYITPFTTNSQPPFPMLNACGEIQFDNSIMSATDTTFFGTVQYANSQLNSTIIGNELLFSSPQLASSTKAPIFYYSAARVSQTGKLLLFGTSGSSGFYYRPDCGVIPPNQTCTNNLLTNPSFATNLTGWNGTGGTWSAGNLEMCQQGNQYLQTVAAEAGKNYQFQYTAKTAGTNQNVLFGLKFLSSSWNVLGSQYSSFDSPGAFGSNFIEKVAPAGTAWVEVSIAKNNSGCVQVSEVCLTTGGAPNPCAPDVTKPLLSACPTNQSLSTTTSSVAANWLAPSATDNCPGSVTVTSTHNSGQAFAVGATTVTYTARDAANNTATCSFVVTVTQQSNPCAPDVTKPVLSDCPSNQNLTNTTGSVSATWVAPTATDNCAGAVTVTASATSGQQFAVGTTTIIYTARDAANNSATCSFVITVQAGNSGTCTNNLLTNPSFATNLSGWNGTGGTWSGGNLEICQQGNQYIQTVAAEAGKNYQFQYTAKTAGTNQNVLFGLKFLSSSWNVLGSQYSSFDSPGAFGSNFIEKAAPVGTAWVEVSIAKNNSGCVQVSEVCLTTGGQPNPCASDVTKPVLSACPSNQSLSTTTGSATATWTAPTANDNCPGSVTVTSTHNSGQAFAVGATTVTYTARDAANNTATCSFVITVQTSNTGTCTNNLLNNPSFATDLSGWNGTGGTASGGSLEMCQQGNQYIQTVGGEAGKNYQFQYTAKTAGTNQNVLFGLKFLSSSWNVLGTQYSSFDSPGAFGTNFIEKAAPVGTAWVEVSIAKQNSGCVQISEVCLTKSGTQALQSSQQTYTAPDPFTEVVIYPNPAAQQAFIDMSVLEGAPTQIRIYDAFGKLHHSALNTASIYDLDLSGWESGVYMVQLETEGKRAQVLKLVVVGL
jgi:hypothetical protein